MATIKNEPHEPSLNINHGLTSGHLLLTTRLNSSDLIMTNSSSSNTTNLLSGHSAEIVRQQQEQMLRMFEKWPEADQTEFVKSLLSRMSHCQHSLIDLHLGPMLQRDFISLLPSKSLSFQLLNHLIH